MAARPAGLDRSVKSTVAICSLVYLLDGLVHTVLGPLAPAFARSLDLTNAQLGPIFSANLIGQCVGLVLFPLAAPRIGHRRIVIIAQFGFAAFQLLSGAATDAGQLFLCRLVTGVFLGGALPSALAMVTAATPPARRGVTITILFFGYGLGCMLAGLSNLSGAAGGWRTPMAVIGALCLISALIAARWLPEPRDRPAERLELSRGSAARDALALLAPSRLLGTLMLWLLFVAMLTISYCLNSWLPILLVQAGRDPALASLSITIFGFGGVVAAVAIGALTDRFGPTRVLVAALLVSTVLLYWIGQVLATASTAMLLVLLALCGFFALGTYAGINIVLADYYPPPLRALGIGFAKSIGRLGTVVAPILIGFGLTAGLAETTIMSLFALPSAVSVFALLVIAAVRRASDRRAAASPSGPESAQ